MMLNHECPICKKIYQRDCTPEPDMPCPECEVDIATNPPLRYFIGNKEVTKEEYDRFLKGEGE